MIKSPDDHLPNFVRIGATISDAERRSGGRYRAVYRVAPVRTARDLGLARVRNISDSGIALDVGFPVCLGDGVAIALSEDVVLAGRVVWTVGSECGVKFDRPVDSLAALRRSADFTRGPLGRPPRLPLGRTALTTGECGVSTVEVRDVSQRGMKIAHDGSFAPGLRVKVVFGSGIERRGIVRWAKDGLAGLMLTETFTAQELGSIRAL